MNIKSILLAGSLLSSSVFANPWVECGIGGVIATLFDNKKAANIIASVANSSWDWGTTATTSATITPDMCLNKEVETAKLILETYPSLEGETANGYGENLVALMNILEIEASERPSFIEDMRTEFSAIVAQDEYASMTLLDKAKAYHASVLKVSNI